MFETLTFCFKEDSVSDTYSSVAGVSDNTRLLIAAIFVFMTRSAKVIWLRLTKTSKSLVALTSKE